MEPSHSDPLEDLYTEALLNRKIRAPKQADPSIKQSLDAAAKKMKDLYNLPENWERRRGLALLDKETHTLIGNFSEYVHKVFPSTRKLIREHLPISIDGTEMVEGYLGARLEQRIRGNTWEAEHQVTCNVLLDEFMVEAPAVRLLVKTRLGAIVRADLISDTQFASSSGNTLLMLPTETNIWEACGVDTKSQIRKEMA